MSQLKAIISYSDARLTTEERNLLSIAYKNITGNHRNSWRTIDILEKQETLTGHATKGKLLLLRRQRERIERDLANTCKDLLNLLDKQLVPAASVGEEKVFYHKM